MDATESQQPVMNGEVKTHFVEKVSNIPVVSAAVDIATNTYTTIKGSNKVVNAALTTAESSVTYVAQQAKPIVEKFEKQVQAVDTLACKGLDSLQEKAPILSKEPHEILDETKKLCSSTVQNGLGKCEDLKNYGTEKVKALKEYGCQKASDLMTSPTAQSVMSSVDSALTVTEKYVDHYLSTSEGSLKPETSGEGAKPIGERVVQLSTKVKHGLYKHVMSQLQNLQYRSKESISRLHYTVDLIQYSKDNIESTTQKIRDSMEKGKQQASWLWEELNKKDLQEETSEKTTEQKIMSVARRVTQQLVQTYNTATTTVASLPQHIQDSAKAAYDYSLEVYKQFESVTHLSELTAPVLENVRSKLTFIEETMSKLLDSVESSEQLPKADESEDCKPATDVKMPVDATTSV